MTIDHRPYNARIAALRPDLVDEKRGRRAVDFAAFEEDLGFRTGWVHALTIEPAALEYLLTCAETLAASGNAPALGGRA